MDRHRQYLHSQEASTRRDGDGQARDVRASAAAVAALLRGAPPRCAATRVVAIDGRSGAGKSTLAGAVAAALGGAPVVSLEHLYEGWDGLAGGIERAREAVLQPLAAGRTAAVPHYDWHAGGWGRPWSLQPPAELVIEGVGAGATALRPFLSVLVWIELDAAARRARALARDGALYARHWQRWARQEDALLARERTRERADLVVAGAG